MTRRSEGHQASIGLNAAQGPLVATYQTRISDYGDMVRAGGDATLSAYAKLYGQVQRKLFAAAAAGRSAVLLKRGYIKERYGLTVHQAAALVLARRSLGFSERIPRRWVAPIGNGVQVAFTVPVRKRVKHVWTYWGAISGQLRPALAAQHRLGKRRRRPNPVQAVVRAEARGVA